MTRPVVFLTQPRGGSLIHAAARDGYWMAESKSADAPKVLRCSPSSPTAQFTHNLCWASMLNLRERYGLTHFAMIHADVCPTTGGWLDVLLAEMAKHDADILSAIIALKDERGLTSTGIDFPENIWGPRRVSMAEAFEKYPVTWTDPLILLNTGLWVAKIGPWCEKVAFRINDRIVYHTETSEYAPQMISEDWDFTRLAKAEGALCYATRIVGVEHEKPEWHNRAPWGTWKTDTACAEVAKKQADERAAANVVLAVQ